MPFNYFTTRLRSTVQNGIQRLVLQQEVGHQVLAEVLIGQGKYWFFNHRSFHSACFSKLKDLHVLLQPGAGFPARPDSLIVNRRRNISVVGAVSRPFSVPSVSGTTFQVCGYHIDCALCELSELSGSDKIQNKPMSACGTRSVLVQCYLDASNLRHGDLPWYANNGSLSYNNRTFSTCRKASMCLKNHDQPGNTPIFRYMMYNIANRWCNFSPYAESGLRFLHSSSRSCFSAGNAPNVSFDNCAHEEQLASSTISSDQKIYSGKSLKLLSGSCYLPHPDKEETGGEDAHFICDNKQAIGVADGVGGWADLGVDAGLYSRELMSNSVYAIQEEVKGSIDPARVLEKAHSSTKAKGSSTACIVALSDQGLQAINLGDSGFMVVRDGCTIFRSPVQQHDFNYTYQLESGDKGDLPSSGQVFTVAVAPGDVLVAGTDGLFDNLYNNEITAVVVLAIRAGLGPQVTAQKIAALARQRAQDKDRQTPFSTAAQNAGFRYYGGKLDDITVVVSYVTSSHEENKSCS
ncbi:probable protein phosphatase 2C 55 isoform X2 [Tripterygium wilfordii]|uniref:probable protein phosphatase 2C 55 isoform X2 n=1 Tax=Tripterygium wilfordii TaxID=458696 RepID=UPI0018F7FFDE|nr:probable protein phosphatase 2C 55 isoform X2 [Tripterygium wilfordii]